MRVPLTWLREYCDPGLGPGELAERLAMTGTEVERVSEVELPSDGGSAVEHVLELAVTPNRVDCLGVYGVAREVHAVTGAPLAPPPWAGDAEAAGEGEAGDHASVEVHDPDLCPRFTARVFTGVKIARSPLWLAARLHAAGMRPINNVVDVTNYAMLLTAQPLHAFDLDRVAGGGLIVRRAREGETLVTLDGEERRFDGESMLVSDGDGPSGIAGIMGGQRSEVSEETTRVLLEVATWNGVNIHRTSNLLGLRSEASTRFEKQLHPELCTRAQRVASKLLVEVSGASLVPGTIDARAGELPPPRVRLRIARLVGLLGEPIDAETAAGYLERLGFAVERRSEELVAEVPPDRHFDVTREADLIEEVARVHGLERLPATLPAARERIGGLTRAQLLRRRAEDLLRDLGFDEIVGWSFADPGLADRLRLGEGDPRRAAVALQNPLSEEHAVMRTTLLGSLLDAARHNFHHGAARVALFESGRVYLRAGGAAEAEPVPDAGPGADAGMSTGAGPLAGRFAGRTAPPALEPHRLACLAAGPAAPPSWGGEAAPAGFYAVKGVFESLAGQLGAACAFEPLEEPFLHPGRGAAIAVAGRPAGWLGEVHPLVARAWDLEGAAGFEVDLAPLVEAASAGRERYEDVTSFPAVHQDIAVVVDEQLPAVRVREAVLAGGGELLRAAEVFDLYRGEQAGEGKKSLALRLEFRAADRTLTDAEVAERRREIAEALAAIGGTLRA